MCGWYPVCVCVWLIFSECLCMSVRVCKWMNTNYVHHIQTRPHKSWIAKQPLLKSWQYTPPPRDTVHIPSIYLHNIYIYIYTRHEPISDKFFVPAKVTVSAIHSQDFGASRASQDQKARTQGPQAQHISSSFQLFKLRKGWRKWLEMTHSNIEMLVYKQRLCTSCFYFHVHIYMGKCWLIMHVCLHVFNKLL